MFIKLERLFRHVARRGKTSSHTSLCLIILLADFLLILRTCLETFLSTQEAGEAPHQSKGDLHVQISSLD